MRSALVFTEGSFCPVSKGVKCPKDLSACFHIKTEDSGHFERTLIMAEEAAPMIINGLYKDVLRRLPMEIGVEAIKLLGLKSEGSAGFSTRTGRDVRRRVHSAEFCRMRYPASAQAACCGESGTEHIDRGRSRFDACVVRQDMSLSMSRIAEFDDTPNPSAMKLLLKESLTLRMSL